MNRTTIEWVRNPIIKSPELDPKKASSYEIGYTFNPITGCLNGCPYCYARRLANGRLKSRYLANSNTAPRSYGVPIVEDILTANDPFYPRFWPERLSDKGLGMCEAVYKKRGIFVCDMGELFGDWIPQEWQRQIFEVIKANPWHRFYLLTKQPQNLAKFSPFPPNCWVGVTATDRASFDKAVHYLAEVAADIKYISFEPLLEPVFYDEKPFWGGVEWVIIGAQTKPYKPPKTEWVQEIVGACDKAGIPVFIKNNLAPYARNLALYPDMKVGDKGYDEIRQEMPR